MSDSTVAQPDLGTASEEQMKSALFAHLIMQQSNMAMMLLGKTAHPETGQTMRDLEAAKMFIDLLEMLEAKTKGNLSKEESSLLKSALMATRMAYVETANAPDNSTSPAAKATTPEGVPAPQKDPGQSVSPSPAPADGEEHKKKFTKKY